MRTRTSLGSPRLHQRASCVGLGSFIKALVMGRPGLIVRCVCILAVVCPSNEHIDGDRWKRPPAFVELYCMGFQRWVRVRSLPQHLADPNPSNDQGKRYALIAPLTLFVEDQQYKNVQVAAG